MIPVSQATAFSTTPRCAPPVVFVWNPDVALLRLCAEIDATSDALFRIIDDDEILPLFDRAAELAQRIAPIVPMTSDGAEAKATALAMAGVMRVSGAVHG